MGNQNLSIKIIDIVISYHIPPYRYLVKKKCILPVYFPKFFQPPLGPLWGPHESWETQNL